MNIVVCDDQLDYLNLIEKKIVQCFDEKEIPLNTYTYSNIKDLIDSVKKHSYQFAFIEMNIENGKGVEAAQLLRKANPACRVIFISDKYRQVQEAFQVHALEYLLKPIDTNKFKDVMNYALDWYRSQNIKFVVPGKASGTKELNEALGNLYIAQGQYDRAVNAFGDTKTNSAALAQILAKDYNKAKSTLSSIAKPDAYTDYLMAVVGARTNNSSMVMDNLKKAVAKDSSLAKKAASDLEFSKYFTNADFMNIIK